MLEGYIISWAVDDPVTGEEIINTMSLQEFWNMIQDASITYDDLGFYLEDNVSLPVNPPAPEPFQGMEEADIIIMMNDYITSTPEGVELPGSGEAEDEAVEDDAELVQPEENLPEESDKKESSGFLAGNNLFITAVIAVMILSLLNKK